MDKHYKFHIFYIEKPKKFVFARCREEAIEKARLLSDKRPFLVMLASKQNKP